MSEYELIAIDVDGTLLTSDFDLAPGALDSIQAVRARGIRVSLVTGRGMVALAPIQQALQIEDQPYIAFGGACIVDPSCGEVIYHCPLIHKDAEMLVAIARQEGVGVVFDWQDKVMCEADADLDTLLREAIGEEVVRSFDILAEKKTVPTKATLLGDPDRLKKAELALRQKTQGLHMIYAGSIFLEVTRAGVDKGNALRRLAGNLQIALERTVAIGDGRNDKSMLEVAGLSIAVGNAPPELKAVADIIAPTNDEGGVAWALHELVLRD